MGSKMDYNVAADGPDRKVANIWMDSADKNAVPTAFIVGKEGKIIWIGNPLAHLDQVLDEIDKNKFDQKAWVLKNAAEDEAIRQEAIVKANVEAMVKGPIELLNQGRITDALAQLDATMRDYPGYIVHLAWFRFNILRQIDPKSAVDYAKALSVGAYSDDPDRLNGLARTILGEKMFKSADYPVALEIAQRLAVLMKNKNGLAMDTLADAHYKLGHFDKAIEFGEKAVALIKSDPGIPPEAAKMVQDHLALYKKR